MAEWFARYPNDNGEYEITFRGTYTQAKYVEKACHEVMAAISKNIIFTPCEKLKEEK